MAVSAQATFAATLVDELSRCGVRHAVLCPGSRSTPLAVALAADRRIRLHVRLDERSAGFYALGIGLATGTPAVVCTTSGTAAVELHPALVEAHHARVPLIALTADRPPELHDTGAPQTVLQHGIYPGLLRFSVDPGVPTWEAGWSWRSLASRLYAEACGGARAPGPVHANLAFREPLLGEPGVLPAGRPSGGAWHAMAADGADASPETVDSLIALRDKLGCIVAGGGASSADPGSVLALGAALGWPVIADPRSGARVAGSDAVVVSLADPLLRVPRLARELLPEVIIQVGEPPASKIVTQWLASAATHGSEMWAVDRWGEPRDPARVATKVISCDPGSLFRSVLAALADFGAQDRSWELLWQDCQARAEKHLADFLGSHNELSEVNASRMIWSFLSRDDLLVVSSSMPVRALEWFAPAHADPPGVIANRGANGIDGVLSTALGVAASGGRRVTALLGDLAFLHDVSALSALEPVPDIEVFVLDNGGGGIFRFLPQARELDPGTFERLFVTAPVVEVEPVARGFGWSVDSACSVDELADVLSAGRNGDHCRGHHLTRIPIAAERVAAGYSECHAAVAESLEMV